MSPGSRRQKQGRKERREIGRKTGKKEKEGKRNGGEGREREGTNDGR